MDDGVGNDHFRIKQRTLRQLPVQKSAPRIGPVDHRGDCEDFFSVMVLIFHDIPELHHFAG
jgi:hypothetical protein